MYIAGGVDYQSIYAIYKARQQLKVPLSNKPLFSLMRASVDYLDRATIHFKEALERGLCNTGICNLYLEALLKAGKYQ